MKEFDLIIKNGTVVTSTESFLCDVAVKDGKIAAMAQNIEADAKEIYDAAGKLVLPGALDAHTHIWLCHLVELFPLTVTWQVLVLLPVVVSQRFLTILYSTKEKRSAD